MACDPLWEKVSLRAKCNCELRVEIVKMWCVGKPTFCYGLKLWPCVYIPLCVGVDSSLPALAASSLRNCGASVPPRLLQNNARKGRVRLRIIIVRERKGLRTCGFRSEHCVFE